MAEDQVVCQTTITFPLQIHSILWTEVPSQQLCLPMPFSQVEPRITKFCTINGKSSTFKDEHKPRFSFYSFRNALSEVTYMMQEGASTCRAHIGHHWPAEPLHGKARPTHSEPQLAHSPFNTTVYWFRQPALAMDAPAMVLAEARDQSLTGQQVMFGPHQWIYCKYYEQPSHIVGLALQFRPGVVSWSQAPRSKLRHWMPQMWI